MVKIKVYNAATGEVSEEDFIPPAPSDPTPYQIAKTTPWVRMTRAEAAIMDTVMSETDAQQKQIYMAAQFLSSDDPLWQTLWQLLRDNLSGGEARANELLAPEI